MYREPPTWTPSRILGLVFLGLALLVALLCLVPLYVVWQQGKSGEASLRKAEHDRKIVIQEAMAKREAAELLAQAEIERAKGVAEANRIIGEGLKGNDEYLRYLMIQSLEATAAAGDKVIYVPTEANIPVLEAGRFLGAKE